MFQKSCHYLTKVLTMSIMKSQRMLPGERPTNYFYTEGVIMPKTNIVDWTTITNFVIDAFVGYGIPRADEYREVRSCDLVHP